MEIRPETLFLTKLIREGNSQSVVQLVKDGFNQELFSAPYKDVLTYIFKYRHKFKQIPTEDEIIRDFGGIDKSLLFTKETPRAAIGAIYEEIIRNSVRSSVIDFNEGLHKEFQKLEGLPLLEYLEKATREVSARYTKCRGKVHSLADLVDLLKEDYEKVITGQADGIPIPFLFLQEELHGWQDAQMTTVVAKTGIGKTWFLLLCACTAATGDPFMFHRPDDYPELTEARKQQLATKVLLVSCEMPAIDIGRRISALFTKISFNRLRSGKLSHEEKELYFRRLDSLVHVDKEKQVLGVGHNIRIVGPEVASNPEQILAQAEDFDAKLVLVDGFYYMAGQGERRWEKIEGNMQQMRLHTLMTNRHYILASQFRRDSKALQSSTTDDAAFSVSIGQDSNNMIGLYQPKGLKASKQLDMSALKMRDGSVGTPYRFHWDLYDINFSQVGPVKDDAEPAQSSY